MVRPGADGIPGDVIAATAALQLECRIETASAIADLACFAEQREDASGTIVITTLDPDTDLDIRINLGRRFALDPDLVARLETVAGVTDPKLSLVAPHDFRVR